MTLIDDLNEWYENNFYPPHYSGWLDDKGITLEAEEDKDEARWGTWVEYVYTKDTEPGCAEYAAVLDCRPATEMQDWGDYGEPEIYPVVPKVEIIERVVYEKR